MGVSCGGMGGEWQGRRRGIRESGESSEIMRQRHLAFQFRSMVMFLADVHGSVRLGVAVRGIRDLGWILSREEVRGLCSVFLCSPGRPPILGPGEGKGWEVSVSENKVVGRRKDTHEIFKLPPRLLDDAVLAAEDETYLTQIADLGPAYDQGVDVKPAPGEDAGDAREDTWFVLDEAV